MDGRSHRCEEPDFLTDPGATAGAHTKRTVSVLWPYYPLIEQRPFTERCVLG